MSEIVLTDDEMTRVSRLWLRHKEPWWLFRVPGWLMLAFAIAWTLSGVLELAATHYGDALDNHVKGWLFATLWWYQR